MRIRLEVRQRRLGGSRISSPRSGGAGVRPGEELGGGSIGVLSAMTGALVACALPAEFEAVTPQRSAFPASLEMTV
jgi:hypothetical protein